MRTKALSILQALSLAALIHPALAQEPPRILVDDIRCLPADGQARIGATVRSASPVTSMRVLFRSGLSKEDYYIEMRPAETGRDRYWAVLPQLQPDGKFISYSLLLKTVDGTQARTPLQKLVPASGCSQPLTREEQLTAKNLVVGQTVSGQPAFPPGFDCADIIKQITSRGQMQSVYGCAPATAIMAGSTPPLGSGGAAPSTSSSQGGSGGGLVIGGVGGTSVSPGVIQGQSSPARPTPGPRIQ